jgi:hypothetical protein
MGGSLGLLLGGTLGLAAYVAWDAGQNLWDVVPDLLGQAQLAGPADLSTAPRPAEPLPEDYGVTPKEIPLPARPVGEVAEECSLRDLDGQEVHLKDFVGRMPVVVEFCSFT